MTPDSRSTHMNAVKHGLRSDTVLLPGDDAAEFHQRRRDAFHTYQPRTADEADCVETIVEMTWRNARARRWQQALDAQVTAHCENAANLVPEADTHRRLHGAIDCTLHQQRLLRLLYRAQERLVWFQKLRRQHLLAGAAADLPSYVEFMERGEAQAAEPYDLAKDRTSEDRALPDEMGPVGRASPPAAEEVNRARVKMNAEASQDKHTTEPRSGLLPGAALPGASGMPPAPARPTKSERGATPSPHGETGKSDERNPTLAMVRRYWPRGAAGPETAPLRTAQPTRPIPPGFAPVSLPTP